MSEARGSVCVVVGRAYLPDMCGSLPSRYARPMTASTSRERASERQVPSEPFAWPQVNAATARGILSSRYPLAFPPQPASLHAS